MRSISPIKAVAGVVLLATAFAGLPAYAQGQDAAAGPASSATTTPSDAEMAEGLFVSTVRRRSAPASAKAIAACKEQRAAGDIVVCGADRGEEWRVPSTTDSDPASREAQNTGIARAPDVSSLPGCARGCLDFGKALPQVMTINLAALPKAPKDSDADRIARGEMAER